MFPVHEFRKLSRTSPCLAIQPNRGVYWLGQVIEAYVTIPSGCKHELASGLHAITAAGTLDVFMDCAAAKAKNYAYFPLGLSSGD